MAPDVTRWGARGSLAGLAALDHARAIGWAVLGGLVVVFMLLTAFIFTPTITVVSSVNAVQAASQISTAFQDVRHAADIEAAAQDAYWRESHAYVRAQFDAASQNIDSALLRVAVAASTVPGGDAADLATVRSLRTLQTRLRTTFGRLADAIDAGDKKRADDIDYTVLDPLIKAISGEIATAVDRSQAEVTRLRAVVTSSVGTSRAAILIGTPLGLALIVACALVLGVYRRRLDAATHFALRHLLRDAMTDALTGLGNHRAFQEGFVAATAEAHAAGTPLALVLVDLDDFKLINDRHGHKHGDGVLAAVGALLGTSDGEDRAFRLGGDEFAVLFPGMTLEQAVAAMERRRQEGAAQLFGATLSIGISVGSDGDSDALREEADGALYEAKRRGRDQVVTFTEIQDTATIMSSVKIRAVRRLLAEESVSIAFQPIWDLNRCAVLAVEALARPDPELGLEGPGEAFAIAEKLGRAHELDGLCQRAVLARAAEIPDGVLLFLNIIPQSLEHDAGLVQNFVRAVNAAGLLPERIVIEITERRISRLDTIVRAATALRAAGFRIALDDVGSGNAGLELLRRVPLDYVKIDRSVISGAANEAAARSVLAAIVAFAREAGVFVIAEGIDTEGMLAFVRHVGTVAVPTHGGIQGAQGYLLGRPSTAPHDAEAGLLALARRQSA